jgi:outer membrane protein TolC
MKLARLHKLGFHAVLTFATSAAALAQAAPEALPFRRAMELAVQHSATMAAANADQQRAYQGYLEARNVFIPQLVVGSGIAYTHGFPMSIEGSAPSVLNVNAQSFLFNPAQRQFVKAAKIDWSAMSLATADKRSTVVLDAAATYIELDKVTSELKLVAEQSASATRQQDITRQRVDAGIEAGVELTKARLAAARVRMRLAELETTVNALRAHLADLTGRNADQIVTDPESIPALPEPAAQAPPSTNESLAVRLADEQARAKEERARAEHKQWYPAFDLVGQYGLFAKFNNYEDFFRKFERHNATVGVAIRFPFFNASQRARAAGADVEALKARRDAESVRRQVSAEQRRLEGVVRQLAATRDVTQLEYELARAETQSALARVQAGTANIKEQESARIDEIGRFETVLDTTFELQKAQLQLLRASGELERWAGVSASAK